MIYGIYQSAAGMQANQYRQDVLANNLANVDTAGFKRDLTVMRERKVESREDMALPSWTDRMLDRMTGGTLVAPTVTSFRAGPMRITGNRLDAALADRGFFTVQDGENTRYTRDGRFAVNANGYLVQAAGGQRVLDTSNRPIRIPSEAAGSVRIMANGDLQAGDEVLGTLGIVDFADTSKLRKTGSNLFQAIDAEPIRIDAQLRTQTVEGSTVEPTKTMVSMIEVMRSYEMNASLVSLVDGTLGRAVNDIARIR
jgi:flagellar basal-body rod protein FlgG